MGAQYVIWLVFAVCLAVSFLLSGMEAGVFALSRLRIRQQMRAGRSSAKVLHGLLDNPENFLWTILVGNTIANFLILGWAFAVLHRSLAAYPFWLFISYTAIVFMIFVLFDLLPKMLFRTYPNRLCMALARPFRFVHLLLRPLVGLVEWVSARLLGWTGGKAFKGYLFGNREELRFMMQESAQVFTSEERAMINRVLDMPSLRVRQITKPFEQAVTVSAQAPVGEVLGLARQHRYTRLPAWETRDGQRRIVGLVNLNTLLYQPNLDETKPVAEFLRPALYLEEDLRAETALRRMQRSGQRMALVLGRDQREIGLVSLQDILKVIFGEVSL